MCLIAFAWRPGHRLPLLLIANRDEFHARPARPLAEWADAPGLFAGRDLSAGGSWLGVNAAGRFAALTNIRNLHAAAGRRSRGELVVNFLRGSLGPQDYLQRLRPQCADYGGFNLLLGDRRQLFHFNAEEGRVLAVPPGVHGLSNAGLNSPWPKLVQLREALAGQLSSADLQSLWALLQDSRQPRDSQLPDTGIGLEWERLLAPVFIRAPQHGYGTRASSQLRLFADGRLHLAERSFDSAGALLGECHVRRQALHESAGTR